MAESPTYPNAQAALDALRPGWRITGERPYYENVPNVGAAANEPATIAKQTGTVLSVMGPNGQPDEIVIGNSDKTVVWNTTPGAPLPKAVVVLKGPSKELSAGGQASDPSKWTPIYRIPGDSTSGLVAQWDPVNKEYHPVAAPQGAQPSGEYTPVYREPNKPASGVIALVDDGDKSFHPVAGEPNAKPSGEYSNVVDPRDPTGKRIIGMVDTGSKTFHPLAQDPATQKQVVTTPNKIFVLNADGTISNTIDVDKNSPYQAVVIDGVPYSFDPNETDPNKRFTKAPGDWEHPDIKDAAGNPMVWDDAQGKYAYPPGVTPAATLSTITTAPELIWYGPNGEEIKRVKNPNYAGRPQPTQAVQSTTAPYIQQWNPQSGAWEWVENKGRVTASAALQNMASILSGQVVDGKISVDEAKELISGANTAMTNAISAAGQVLDYTSEGARTGAGMLQQRAATAQGMLGNVLGMATGGGMRAGNYTGGLMSVPAGIGAELAGGIQSYTADLMGGQSTLDAAARMVQAAAPGGSTDVATAVGALTQMLDRYRQMSGTDHPIVQGQRAAQQSVQQNAVVSPVPTQSNVSPLKTAAQAIQANLAANPAGAVNVPPSQQPFVAPGQPMAASGLYPAATANPMGVGFNAPPMPTINFNF